MTALFVVASTATMVACGTLVGLLAAIYVAASEVNK